MSDYPTLSNSPEAIEERKRSLVQLLLNGVARNQTRAAMMLGINPKQITEWGHADPEFKAALAWAKRQAMQDKIEQVEDAVFQNAIENMSFGAQRYFLEHHAEEYRPQPQEPATGPAPIEAGWREAVRPQRLDQLPMGRGASPSAPSPMDPAGSSTSDEPATGRSETSS